MALKAIILDFDGVLVESNNIKHRAFAEIFKDFPDHFEEMMEFHENHNHIPRDEKFRYFLKNLLGKADCELQVQDMVARFRELTRAKIIECPYVAGAMDFISGYSKVLPLYIASATPLDELEIIIKARELDKYFLRIYGAPMKKSAMFIDIMKNDKFSSGEMLFVGDSLEDYYVARDQGLAFVARSPNGDFKAPGVRTIKDFLGFKNIVGAV